MPLQTVVTPFQAGPPGATVPEFPLVAVLALAGVGLTVPVVRARRGFREGE